MKTKDSDVPQQPPRDERWKKAAYVIYTVDEQGEYTTTLERDDRELILSYHFSDSAQEKAAEAKKRVLAGETSAIEYYMYKRLLDPPALAQAMGIATWRVKRHFKPAVFRKLSREMLEEYAKVFGISMNELIHIEEGV
jgi:hypothetical protein